MTSEKWPATVLAVGMDDNERGWVRLRIYGAGLSSADVLLPVHGERLGERAAALVKARSVSITVEASEQ